MILNKSEAADGSHSNHPRWEQREAFSSSCTIVSLLILLFPGLEKKKKIFLHSSQGKDIRCEVTPGLVLGPHTELKQNISGD